MKTFHIEVLSPQRTLYIGDCLSLVVPASDGSVGIMAGRAPMTAAMPAGEIKFTKPDGERVICAVTNGLVSVSRKGVKVLCESIALPGEIDTEKENKTLAEAELKIRSVQAHKDYIATRLAIIEAKNKLKIKKHVSVND